MLIATIGIGLAFVLATLVVLGVVGNHDAFLVEEQDRRQRERRRREFERALLNGLNRRID